LKTTREKEREVKARKIEKPSRNKERKGEGREEKRVREKNVYL
jgi:hypothetical protein